ncbi:N-acetylneuraminate synthase [Actibacterium pelagium]|uniref:N-acetylneuraminate synthase n=1 Tax=Actibacterium pelagium TaxID=2029103 RepID=A0A917EIC3_9RHOB|nr:N-acetylneuraminate synthase [Actibacterium pelagium]GGE39588.1 N-acetylneuraminate synthase [Actibacterium pelagium]
MTIEHSPKTAMALIADPKRCFIIAEIGVNHNGSMEQAKKMIDAASGSGADAVKFQLFRTEKLVTSKAEKANYQKETTGYDDNTQWAMLKSLELTEDQHKELQDYCRSKDIIYLCTPYDEGSARFLAENLSVEAIKVASTDATNIPFLEYLATLGRPVILSVGMCTMEDVETAVEALSPLALANKLSVFQCTSEYPAPVEEVNLRVIQTFANAFDCPVGFSDHTKGSDVAAWAVAHGAMLLEKHFTLDKKLPGPDHRASIEPQEFSELVRKVRAVELALGRGEKTVTASEGPNRENMQKSIYFAQSLQAGHLLKREDLICKRPAKGLAPRYLAELIGCKLSQEVKQDMLVSLSHLTKPEEME